MLARARAVTLWNYVDLARCLGADPYEILHRCGLRASALDNPENWLPGTRILEVLEQTAKAAARDDFGVLLGEFRSFGSLGPVSLLLKHETTLRGMIISMIHYRRLLNELLTLRLEERGDEAQLLWSLIPGLRNSQAINLLATIAYRVLVDGAAVGWAPDCVHFRHSAPIHIAAFRRVFRCRIEFNSDFDGLSFRSEFLESRNAFGDAELAEHAKKLLNLLPGIMGSPTTSERARATITFLLTRGEADAENVADLLGLSSRTLHRRLRSEGSTFAGVLNAVRNELVERLLRDSTHSVGEIAELMGFAAVSSFTRWFTLQFGMPPRDWRRQAQQKPQAPDSGQ